MFNQLDEVVLFETGPVRCYFYDVQIVCVLELFPSDDVSDVNKMVMVSEENLVGGVVCLVYEEEFALGIVVPVIVLHRFTIVLDCHYRVFLQNLDDCLVNR